MIDAANEIKVIMPGLGDGREWPDLTQALDWAKGPVEVFIQPRNLKNQIDKTNLHLCMDIVRQYPQLRLSVQMHKFLGER
jgi:organic radical activating enzyme